MSKRPLEDEHFAREDAEKIAAIKAEQDAQAAAAALADRRALHHNRCGKCGGHMDTHPHRGAEIEVCEECGAVLLDRGELETLAGKDQSGFLGGFLALFGGK